MLTDFDGIARTVSAVDFIGWSLSVIDGKVGRGISVGYFTIYYRGLIYSLVTMRSLVGESLGDYNF